MSGLIESIVAVFKDRKAEKKMRALLVDELRGKPLDEVLMLLEGVQKAAKPIGAFMARVADGLLHTPMSEMQKLLGSSMPSSLTKFPNPSAARSTKEKVAKACKLKMSPARKAQLKIQGEYIGRLRSAKPMQKKTAKKIAKKDGMKAAIKFLLKKPAVKPAFVKLAKKPKASTSKVAKPSKTAKKA